MSQRSHVQGDRTASAPGLQEAGTGVLTLPDNPSSRAEPETSQAAAAPHGPAERASVVLVTGMSGAGRSVALKIFEDLGYEAVDNLPLSMLGMLTRGVDVTRPLALGVDMRTRGFSADILLKAARAIKTRTGDRAALLFLDCDDDVLIRRFKETRRRHPLASDRPVSDGIRIERSLLASVRDAADLVVDTSVLVPSELRRLLAGRFGSETAGELTLTVISFAYRQGVPREADLVFDVRFLRNPHYDEALKPLDGRAASVASYIEADPDFPGFFDNLVSLVRPLLPRFLAEGKSYLTIAIGCTGGRHRSVFIAERLASWLGEQGFKAGISHRDVHRASWDAL
jgi:UPF0042 nucleotide-binding protein